MLPTRILHNIYLLKSFTNGGGGDGMVTDALMVNIFMVDLPTISNECLGLKFHGDGWIFAQKKTNTEPETNI